MVLTEFGRDGWGEGGEEFAWWCTESPSAFIGTNPVYKSMEPEIRLMVGDAVYDEMTTYLDRRLAIDVANDARVTHPGEIPVTIGKKHKSRQLPHNFG